MRPYYSESGITIFHGDCREVLPTLAGVCDLVLTDPPYGVSHRPNAAKETWQATWEGNEIAGDGDTTLRDEVLEPFDKVACFGGWRRAALARAHTALIWDKGPVCGGMNFHAPWRTNWEMIFIRGTAFKGGMDLGIITGFWMETWERRKSHQHEKPIGLIQYLLTKAPTADMILDPFMGSGTTLRAAKNLNRRAIGIEIEERYCEIAANRLRQSVINFGEQR